VPPVPVIDVADDQPGRCRLELGRIEEGTASLTEALEFYLRAGKIYRTAALFWHLGAAGKRSDAADFLLMSYRLYSTSEHDYWAMITGLALAEEYARAGRPWDALAAWRRASHFLAASAEHGPIPPDIPERLDRLGDDLRRHFGGTSPSVPHHKIPIASDPAAVRAGGDGRIESNGDDDDDDEDGGE
jgi:tetratricopeptide (TPR) repeat protein